MKRIFLAGMFAALLPLALAQAVSLPAQVGGEVALGKNLTEDPCLLRRVAPGGWGANAERYSLYCEGWKQPSGQLIVLRGDERALTWWLTDSPWAQGFSDSAQCDALRHETGIAGANAWLRNCQHRLGWRRVMTVAGGERGRVLADFLPNSAPLMERALLAAQGRGELPEAPAQGRRMIALRAMEEWLGGPNALISTRTIGRYGEMRELALELHRARHYRRAELVWQNVLALQEEMFGKSSLAVADTLLQMAYAVRNQRRLDDAAALVARAEPIVIASADAGLVAHLAISRCYDASWRQDWVRAEKEADRAVAAAPDTGRLSHEIGEAQYAKAITAYGTGNYAAAEKAAKASYRLFYKMQGAYGVWTNRARLELARSLIAEKKFEEARGEVKDALDTAERMYGRGIWWANARIVAATLAHAEGDTQSALAAYRDYAEVAAREAFSCYFGNCLGPYLDLLGAEALARPQAQASLLAESFAAAQLTESPVVAGAMSQVAARVSAGDPAIASALREYQDLEDQEARLRGELAAEARKPEAQRSRDREDKLAAELATLNRRSIEAELSIQGRFPKYAGLVSRRPFKLLGVQRDLRSDEALIYLSHSGDHGETYLVRPASIRRHRIALDSKALKQAVARLRLNLQPTGGEPQIFDAKSSHELYQQLFGDLLDGEAEVKHLVIVPSGPLLSLPLDVLLIEAPRPGAPMLWLARRYGLTIAPNVAAWVNLRDSALEAVLAKPRAPAFLGLANPRFAEGKAPAGAETNPCGANYDPRALVATLAPLPETEGEARAMAAALAPKRNTVVTGARASKSVLAASELAGLTVLAFSTHGLLPEELFCENEPALALAPGPLAGRADDGLLRASDIVALKIDAELVILSACNTAGADGRLGGEAFSGLTRAFFHAGARNVLATHWPIASDATVTLMKALAQARGKGLPWDEALQEAKRRLMDQPATAHPFYWAAFSLVGGG